jgi:enediyne biosynthesis protein E5
VTNVLSRFRTIDPRWLQIFFLLGLLFFGTIARDLGLSWTKIIFVLGTGLGFQSLLAKFLRFPLSSLKSATISAVSVLLLLRSSSVWPLMAAVMLALGSKYLFRSSSNGKHFFNPSNFGIVVLSLFSQKVWTSPGLWGEETLLILWLAALGFVVVTRSRRADISLAFLFFYLTILGGRVIYLGQPPAVWSHQWQSGSLLLFTFFMISDPRSTPDHRISRIFFAAMVAVFTYFFRFHLYLTDAPLLALFFISPSTVFLDKVWRDHRFFWEASLAH